MTVYIWKKLTVFKKQIVATNFVSKINVGLTQIFIIETSHVFQQILKLTLCSNTYAAKRSLLQTKTFFWNFNCSTSHIIFGKFSFAASVTISVTFLCVLASYSFCSLGPVRARCSGRLMDSWLVSCSLFALFVWPRTPCPGRGTPLLGLV